MANIMLQQFAEHIADTFASSVDNPQFLNDFFQAVNATIGDINQKADTETAIARVSNLTESVGLDTRYQNVLTLGCIYWLAVYGRRPRGADQRNLPPVKELRAELDSSIAVYQADIRNDLDPEEDDIVGLGVCEN